MSELTDPGPPPNRPSPALIASGVVVAVIAVLGLILAVTAFINGGDDPQANPATLPTATATEPTGDDSVCGLEGHETTSNLTTAPTDVTWTLAGRIAVPETETAGPGDVTDSGLRYCYARTPEGALLMAANIYSWEAVGDAEEIARRSLAAGPGREAAIAAAEEPTAGTAETTFLQIRGFRLLAYDGRTALVDLAFQIESSSYAQHSLELVWEEGDWRLRPNLDGSLPRATPIPDLTGYIPFAGA